MSEPISALKFVRSPEASQSLNIQEHFDHYPKPSHNGVAKFYTKPWTTPDRK